MIEFNSTRMARRNISELIGIVRGILADGDVCDKEIIFINKWISSNEGVLDNPMVSVLYESIADALRDGVGNETERVKLFETLTEWTGNDFALGEVTKSTSFVMNDPCPPIYFKGKRFCLSGDFIFGTRAECKAAVQSRGGIVGDMTNLTDFLIIGEYATKSWKQGQYGRKIERAVKNRDKGLRIAIISEKDWTAALNL